MHRYASFESPSSIENVYGKNATNPVSWPLLLPTENTQLFDLDTGLESEYSIYDAINSGFGKIVFVIRREFDDAFRSRFDKFSNNIQIEYAYQDVNLNIEGISTVERTKPWGTSHAVLVAKEFINEPFAVINADDYYGASSFKLIADFLTNNCTSSLMAMVGYTLHNTLSKHGTVNRGVCKVDKDNNLVEVIERIKISEKDGEVNYNIGNNHSLGCIDRKYRWSN